MSKLPIEEVVWEDHFSSTDWTSKAAVLEDNDRILVTSVGYRLKETKTKIVLIQNASNNDQVSNTMAIMKKTVMKRTIIREADV